MNRAACWWLSCAAVFAQPVTFTKQIAPLLFDRCAPCHRPGEAGPFTLLSYADAKKHATQIAAVTQSRFMPPWLPDPGPPFEGERRLSAAEIALIEAWVKAGAPEGDPRALPAAPQFKSGWQLGEPDLVVRFSRPFTLAPGTADVFRNFVLPVSIPSTRFVKAIEIRPGNKKVVHHANVLIDRTHCSRALDGQDGQPGFAGMDVNIESDVFDPDGHFLFWKPGTVPFVEAEGMSWRLDRDTDLVLNMHLQPSGKPEVIEAAIGLYFTDKPPTRFPMLLQLENDRALDIPAGEKGFTVTDEFTLPLDADVLGVYPHAHYLGKDLRAIAVLPGGEQRALIHIRNWDLNWQAVYRYSQPIALPRGTVIRMRYTYDNSDGNVANPSHPPKRVVGGERATDEMGHLWLQVIPRTPEDARKVLQEAWMRHLLVKYPDDFTAHYNLGALLQAQEKWDEANAQFRKALSVKPDNATVLNSLGATLLAQGQLSEAGADLQRAVTLKPDYSDAHFNLGMLWLERERPDAAITQFEIVLQSRPEDAAALGHLAEALREWGRTLVQQGKLDGAMAQFRRLLQMSPEDAGVYNDLGVLLARTGKLSEAVACFEKSVGLNPGDASVRANLERARAGLRQERKD